MTEPLVSVVIINWNHLEHLQTCLLALSAQDYPSIETIVVDNASKDGSVEWLREQYPLVHLIKNNTNRGFSHAFNQGVDNSTGDYLLSLNPDVTILPGFLSALVNGMEASENVGIIAPKLLQAGYPDRIDSTGLFINRCRRPYDRGQGTWDKKQFDKKTDVFGACGAAAFYRRSMLDDIRIGSEYFDEDFFAYYEDVDLAWRAHLKGWRAVYVPEARALHVRGYGDTLRKRRQKNQFGPRLAFRNRYLMTVKNDEISNFFADLPLILLFEAPRLVYTAVTSPSSLLAIIDLGRALPSALKKRRFIKTGRKASYKNVRRWFTKVTFT